MAYYYPCPNCGANLDPGEKCECECEYNKEDENQSETMKEEFNDV